jgi:hypothetical protein
MDDSQTAPEPQTTVPPTEPVQDASLAERSVKTTWARRAAARRTSTVGRAARWVLVIGIMQLLFGIGFGIKNSQDADQALGHLAKFEPDEMLKLPDGSKRTAASLREQIEHERVAGFAIPIGIGLALLALYWWARRSPLPALVSALCLFVLVHGVSAVLKPETLAQGVIVKIFFVMALLAGIKAALAEREVAAAAVEA